MKLTKKLVYTVVLSIAFLLCSTLFIGSVKLNNAMAEESLAVNSETETSAMAGDVNGDEAVNNKDLTRLIQYLAGWDVVVNRVALDINGDGETNNKDLTRFIQYLADWDVEIYVTELLEVRFEANGGTLVSGDILQKVFPGDDAVVPTFERSGYNFIGFDKEYINITEKTTITAQWEEIHIHEFTEQNTDSYYLKSSATCTQKAVYYYSCECGEIGTETFEYGELLEHTYNQQNTDNKYLKSNATCTQKAVYYYSCECGEIGTETFEYGELLEHTYSEQNIDSKYLKSEATCTQKAVYYYSCGCGETGTDTFEYGEPLGHNYVNGVCTKCGDTLYSRVDSTNTASETGNYILFGSYPQTDVTSSMGTELASYVTELPSNGNNNGWTSYKYYISGSNSTDFMWYKDVDVDSNGTNDYRAVYFTSYRPFYATYSSSAGNTYQDNNGYTTNNVYWFKFEPIKWRILTESDGKATILSELILDGQDYNYTYNSRTIDGKTVYGNNYEHSSIRAWLNDNFYNTAFSSLQQEIINTVTVDNSARSTNPDNNATYYNSGVNKYACENTQDKVWLLSEQEVTTAEYGFATGTGETKTRQKKTSEYSQCMGAYTNTSDSYLGNSYWWLRSPRCYHGNDPWFVYYDGHSYKYDIANNTRGGVVPALQISLK